jgi:threonine 3-dehydrogenase
MAGRQTMKALVKESAGEGYSFKEVAVPRPGPGDLLVKVRKVALCGSDIALYQWNSGRHNHR